MKWTVYWFCPFYVLRNPLPLLSDIMVCFAFQYKSVYCNLMLLICFWVPLGEACHEQRMEWYPCLMFTVWEHSLHSYFDWLNLPSYDRMMWHQWAARPDPSHPASRSRIPSDARTQSLQVIRSTPYSGSLCQKWLLFLGAKVVWAKK